MNNSSARRLETRMVFGKINLKAGSLLRGITGM